MLHRVINTHPMQYLPQSGNTIRDTIPIEYRNACRVPCVCTIGRNFDAMSPFECTLHVSLACINSLWCEYVRE